MCRFGAAACYYPGMDKKCLLTVAAGLQDGLNDLTDHVAVLPPDIKTLEAKDLRFNSREAFGLRVWAPTFLPV
jgi:hypothetical protein